MFSDLVEGVSGRYKVARRTQRYISKELTHFVGRGQSAGAQYKLLVRILRTGWLTHPPHDPHVSGNLTVTPSARISQNEMYSPQIVCFSDIPVEDLAFHARKYSCFGLSFDKDFVAQKGGAPVYYIPVKSKVNVLVDLTLEQMAECSQRGGAESLHQDMERGEYFDRVVQQYHKLFQFFHKLTFEALRVKESTRGGGLGDSVWDYPREPDGYFELEFPRHALSKIPRNTTEDLTKAAIHYDSRLRQLERFFDFQVFSHLKFFDHLYPEDHPDNYYYEREWRVVGNVEFSLEDVKRVLIRQKYAKRFREDCPQYYGQLTFLE